MNRRIAIAGPPYGLRTAFSYFRCQTVSEKDGRKKRSGGLGPVWGEQAPEIEPQEAAPVVLGAFRTVLPMQAAHPGWGWVHRGARIAPSSWRYERLGEPGPCPPFLRYREDLQGGQGASQGAESGGKALWRQAIKATHAWIKGKWFEEKA